MKFVLFYHSVLSDWNHGNAHFLRGIATELASRGHAVRIFEPEDSWSLQNLTAEHGWEPVHRFAKAYPLLQANRYHSSRLELDSALADADVVLVHEWNPPALVSRIGQHHARNPGYRLFFHDTHHRMVTAPDEISAYDLTEYDGVLAYGRVLRDLYLQRGLVPRAWTWHEAADIRVFHPRATKQTDGDVVWVGNWGDGERSLELQEFLLEPCRALKLKAVVHGVRYPEAARRALDEAGVGYAGWIPNFEVPEIFSRFRATLHIPRRPYVEALPGIPTIRPFEALACGIPLVSSPWEDAEGLFSEGEDYLVARTGREMRQHLNSLLNDAPLRQQLAAHGWETIRSRHTCAHRVDELLRIESGLSAKPALPVEEPTPVS